MGLLAARWQRLSLGSLLLLLSLAIALAPSFFQSHLGGSLAAPAVGPQAPQCAAVQVESGGPAKSFVTWISSDAAPGGGIVVRVIYPVQARYLDGTAAVVEVPGADDPGSVDLPARAVREDPFAAQGLVHLVFAFPGGGEGPLRSGGVYDHRGLDSLRALRDVVRYLRGKLRDREGCRVDERLPYAIKQVGLLGSSNGGNTAIAALGLFGEQMPVDWYVGWENPAGVQFTTVDLGARDRPNPAYIPGSCCLTPEGARCNVDYTSLRWDGEAVSTGWGPQRGGERGVLYHDLNRNDRYDESDYLLGAYTGTFAGDEKRVYSTAALEPATELELLDPWPEGVATLEEAREFWRIRDMSRYYGDVMAKRAKLRAIVLGSQEDHVQETPDYPHIVLQYRGWREAGMEWVRLNPDAAYVNMLAGRARPVVDNDANMVVDYGNIVHLVEPEVVGDPILQLAAALELSDRTEQDDWRVNLDQPLRIAYVVAHQA